MSRDEKIVAILDQLARGKIPQTIPAENDYAPELTRLTAALIKIQEFTLALANGDLNAPLPGVAGPLAGSLKSHQAALKHLTWQAARVAAGDFSQRVDFLGEFSIAFNAMVAELAASRRTMEELNQQLQDDIVELRRMAAALRESEKRFRLIAESASDVIWTIEPQMQRFSYISPSVATLLGFSAAEALSQPLASLMAAESLTLLRQLMERIRRQFATLGGPADLAEKIEMVQRSSDGRRVPVEVVVSAIADEHGRLKEFVGISRDITERKKAEEKLKYRSTHDSQTDLYNRAYFDAELERIAESRHFPVSFITVDLDGLKQVNDSRGHDAGDLLIKAAARILRSAFRGEDMIARIGGDEFIAVLTGSDAGLALAALSRIRDCTARYNRDHPDLRVSMSLGAATATTKNQIAQALKQSDALMYADKIARKRNR
ncbi:MAG TPA: diguanylate cyclase [Desulforhopalus sp.]|nr:diguanylate cyclase [Desulforhopalus sp.]